MVSISLCIRGTHWQRVNGGIHAREWISSHTAMFLVFSLLSLYGEDDQITKLVNELEFVFAPHINPDGYEYSRSPGHRMVCDAISYICVLKRMLIHINLVA